MELRHTTHNGEIVLTIKVQIVELFVLKNVKIEFKNKSY